MKRKRLRVKNEKQGQNFIDRLTKKINSHKAGTKVTLDEYRKVKWYSGELDKFSESMQAIYGDNVEKKEQPEEKLNDQLNEHNNTEKEDDAQEHEEL